MHAGSQERLKTACGGLSHCLVDGDSEVVNRARQLRREGLLLSVVLQASLLAALILLPLFATGEKLGPRPDLVPVPPWRGSSHPSQHARATGSGPRHHVPTKKGMIFVPPRVPPDIRNYGHELERGASQNANDDAAPGIPDGLLPSMINPGRPVIDPLPAILKPSAHKDRVLHSTEVQEALLTHRLQPVYPQLAVQARIEGRVELHAIIGRDGKVNSLRLISGHPVLAQAALDAVSQWRYRPTLLRGEPVEVETLITVVFKLQR